jgi:hypothetical protein
MKIIEIIPRIFIVLLVLLVFIILRLSFVTDKLRAQRDGLYNQIDMMREESARTQLEYQRASDNAKIEMQRVQLQTHAIITEKVPKECNAAMAWAVKAAKSFR